MNKTAFYDTIRPVLFGGRLSQSQVDGIEVLLNACKDFEDERHTAYLLATAFHETGKTMQPIEEYGKGKGKRYGQKIKRSGEVYETPDHIYYGRSYCQLTWYENYQYMGRLVGEDLLNYPEKCLTPTIAAKIIIIGMTKGTFTGVKLSTYFNESSDRPIDARKIINGLDCAERIAGYYDVFLNGLSK